MDPGKEKNDPEERKEDPGGGGGGVEPGGARQEKLPDDVTATNSDESQRPLSEVSPVVSIEITALLSFRFLEL